MKKKRFQWKSLALLLAAVTALGGLYYYGVFARKKRVVGCLFSDSLSEYRG